MKLPILPVGISISRVQEISVKANSNQLSLTLEERQILESVKLPQVNECGDCNVCCVACAIDETRIDGKALKEAKPACIKCPNLSESGCSHYTVRPDVCRDYLCLYAVGYLDVSPKEHGVAWSVRSLDGGESEVYGHSLDVKAVFSSRVMVDMMVSMCNTKKFKSITVMDSNMGVVIDCKTGEVVGRDIDQSSHLKNEFNSNVTVLGVGIPLLL